MRKLLAVSLLAIPLVANGEKLFLEYEGRVSAVEGYAHEPFAVGDEINGLLTIDLSRAPADAEWRDPNLGQYFGPVGSSPDFIFGRPPPPDVYMDDSVTIGNDSQPRLPNTPEEDYLYVTEGWHVPARSTPNPPQLEERLFVLFASLQGLEGELFEDDGIVQQVDVTPGPGVTLGATLHRSIGDLFQKITFDMSRISLTPGSCRR